MANEALRVVSTSAQVSVDLLITKTLHIKVVGDTVYVYPSTVYTKAAAGYLWSDGLEEVAWPGAVVEFKDSVMQPIGMDGTSEHTVIFAKATKEILTGQSTPVTFRIDTSAGVVLSNVPCDAVLVFNAKSVYYAKYKYDPPVFSRGGGGSSASGIQLDASIAETFQDIVYAIYYPPGWPLVKAQVETARIQMPEGTDFDFYSVESETILTDKGEWHKPDKWDTEEYDKDKAYGGDGSYTKGPDKDEPWVKSSRPLLKGIMNHIGTLRHIAHPMPKLEGSDSLDLATLEKKLLTTKYPPSMTVSEKMLKKHQGIIADIKEAWQAKDSPQSEVLEAQEKK